MQNILEVDERHHFAVLALVASVSANELTEMMGTRYPKATVAKFMKQAQDIGHFVETHEAEMDAKLDEMLGFTEEDAEAWAVSKNGGMRYLKELEAWGQSPAVKAKQAWERKMMASPEGQALMGAEIGRAHV